MSDDSPGTAHQTVASWLRSLSEATPDPGGGAASAMLAGVAAGLVEMVAGYTLDGEATEHDERMPHLIALARQLREGAPVVADRDSQASAGFAPAYAMPAGHDRTASIESAALIAAESVAAAGRVASSLAPAIAELAEDTGQFLRTDVGVAASVLGAGLRSAAITLAGDLRLAGGAVDDRPDLMDALEFLDRTAAELEALATDIRRSLV